MNTHTARVLIQSRQPWPRVCTLALALLVVGCGTTAHQASPEATGAPQAQTSETATGGTNEGSAKAVRTAGRVAGAAAVGVLGAAGGAVLGGAAGLIAGVQCGPFVIICSPVMAAAGAIGVGVAGGVGGAAAVWKATAPDRGETHDPRSTESPVKLVEYHPRP